MESSTAARPQSVSDIVQRICDLPQDDINRFLATEIVSLKSMLDKVHHEVAKNKGGIKTVREVIVDLESRGVIGFGVKQVLNLKMDIMAEEKIIAEKDAMIAKLTEERDNFKMKWEQSKQLLVSVANFTEANFEDKN